MQLPFRNSGPKYGKPLLLTAALALTGCVSAAPIVTATSASCAALLPAEWKTGVEPVLLGDGFGDIVGDWIAAFDGQTAKLEQANDHTASAIGIVERCEARDAAAIKKATRRKFLGLF